MATLCGRVALGSGGTVAFKYDPAGRRVQKVFTQGFNINAVTGTCGLPINPRRLSPLRDALNPLSPLAEIPARTANQTDDCLAGRCYAAATRRSIASNMPRFDAMPQVHGVNT